MSLPVVSVSIGRQKSEPNEPALEITLDELGVQGDRHAGPGVRQVTLFDAERLRALGAALSPGQLSGSQNENIAVEGLALLPIALLDELQIGDARLEVTVLGDRFARGSAQVCADHDHETHCQMEHYGVFARVLSGGTVRAGDMLRHQPRTLRTTLITMSDRVSRGRAEDRSGARAEALLGAWCCAAGWQADTIRHCIPDDRDALGALLTRARAERPHLLITTGGTGISPRDITPEVILAHADKVVPGIMEHIRVKYGATKPLALLSRSVAAVIGETLVFALPGSPRGVEEYLAEISPLLDHMLLVVRGIDPHG